MWYNSDRQPGDRAPFFPGYNHDEWLIFRMTISPPEPPVPPPTAGLSDDFEDGVIKTSLWTVGGGARGTRADDPIGSGDWQYKHQEVIHPGDGYLQAKVWGRTSANTYGAEVWIQTVHNFNDGRTYTINFVWEPEFLDYHYNYYFIQITDGYIPRLADVHWPERRPPLPPVTEADLSGTKDLLWETRSGQYSPGWAAPSLGKVNWSMTIDPAGIAQLYDAPGGTGSLLKEVPLDNGKPWYIRFLLSDATSSGFPAGDARLNLYDFSAPTVPPPVPPAAEAGGPYGGVVGQPIIFDGTGSYDPDSEIKWYCWVWGPDGEGSIGAGPICQHTWYSRFSGNVILAVIDDEGLYGSDTAWVEVTGPERIMSIELASCADLHVYDPEGRHLAINYETKTIEQNIPGASFKILDKDGNEVPYDGSTPDEGLRQVVNLPVLAVGSYRIVLMGTSDGPFHLTINGMQDGEILCCKTYEGEICEGECMTTNAVAGVDGDILTLEFEPLTCLPALGVEPSEVTVSAQSNSVQEIIVTVSERMGKVALHSVSVHCTDLVGKHQTIKGSDVSFDLNNFDIAAGGQQVVHAFIPVPSGFRAKVTGSIVVESADGGTESIAVTIKAARRYPMVVDPGGPYEGVVGQPIRFDASGSYNPNGEIVWYGWDFDSSGNYHGSRQPVCEHTWDAPFSGTVTLVVTDEQGRASAATTTVVVNPAP
jgi:hypothetical protein